MGEFHQGDIVGRRSYNSDVFFQIVDFFYSEKGERRALLKGLDVRLYADSPVSDLQQVTHSQLRALRKKFISDNNKKLSRALKRRAEIRKTGLVRAETDESKFFEMPVRILHLDGNADYLRLCVDIYKQFGLAAEGVHISEKDQPGRVLDLLKKYQPDFLVLTGHDGFIKGRKDFKDIANYRNSRFFVDAVKKARAFESNKDELIIIAGACQSHYEALLRVGANFASSPLRVLIHAFDPVFIVEKICSTSTNKTVSVHDVIENTITGIDGIGGIETRGKLRWGFPKSPY